MALAVLGASLLAQPLDASAQATTPAVALGGESPASAAPSTPPGDEPTATSPDVDAATSPDVDTESAPTASVDSADPDSVAAAGDAQESASADDEPSGHVSDDYPSDGWEGGEPEGVAGPGRFMLEDVRVEGNDRTRGSVIRSYVPLEHGDLIDPEDEEIEAIRWRLLGTGWFRQVHLSLRRGAHRGWVVLVVRVHERNTVVIEQLAFGVSEGLTRTTDTRVTVMPYAGVQLAETNLLGTGLTLRASVLGAQRQQAARLSFVAPHLRDSPMALSITGFFHNGREFFGHDPLVAIRCPPAPTVCDPAIAARNAVVIYRRGGVELGTGRDLGASTRYRLSWRGERVNVLAMPEAASESYGTEVRPIDFAIRRAGSWVSTIRVGLVYDRRNDPALPTRGLLIDFAVDGAIHFIGSDYDFLKASGRVQRWVPLPWGHKHSLRLGAFAGVVFGNAPFFYLFHAADFTDLVPSRVLEMQLDRRPAPNLFGTAVAAMRTGDVVGRVDAEYGMQLYSGTGGVRALNAYVGVGVYGISNRREVGRAVPGYRGAARVPIDLTFDLGLRMDTDIGVFQLGFSNLLGFIQL